jgi:hypothetical protein
MSAHSQPTPLEVARGIVEGLLSDGHLGAMPATRDGCAELITRIAHVIDGERQHARFLFEYYGMDADPGERT